jgi:glycosyltransferase involved in cell wall biosynthesis
MVLENCHYPLDSRVRNEAESLVERGLVVEVLAPREPGRPTRESIRGVRVSRFPLPEGHGEIPGTALEYLAAFCVISLAVLVRLARSPSGTLHVHNPPDFFFPLLLLARWRGWSTVFDHHDDTAGMFRSKVGRSTFVEGLLRWMRDRSARVADLTIATNGTQRIMLESAARSVAVVRNTPPAWFASHRASAPSARPKLVYLGEIGAQDGVERAVDITSMLVRDRTLDVELLVIGDGPRRSAVEDRAREQGVAGRVTVTGWVPYEEVPALLASAHVGLDTAPLTEVNHGSTMVKIFEYLAVGLPVVASGLRETKTTGGTAIITIDEDKADAFAEPLVRLVTDASAWSLAARLARARSKQLRWDTEAAVLVAAYANLQESRCDRRGRARGRHRHRYATNR